jgi:hypothetical protein
MSNDPSRAVATVYVAPLTAVATTGRSAAGQRPSGRTTPLSRKPTDARDEQANTIAIETANVVHRTGFIGAERIGEIAGRHHAPPLNITDRMSRGALRAAP